MAWNNDETYVTVDIDGIIAETDLAIMLDIGEEEGRWVPRSQIDGGRDLHEGDQPGSVDMLASAWRGGPHMIDSIPVVNLKLLGVHATVALTNTAVREKLFLDPKVSVNNPVDMNVLVWRLVDYVWAEEHIDGSYCVKYPATWWQHFKDACVPRKLLKLLRAPVRLHTETFTFKRTALFPTLRVDPGSKTTLPVVIKEAVEQVPGEEGLI